MEEFIKCSKCKCKYINDEEHVKTDFGYNRLGRQYKSCVKCRVKSKTYYESNASKICDYQRNKYYEPCSTCNERVYKYQMKQHQASPLCALYAERNKQKQSK
jgi:hypothetical protein